METGTNAGQGGANASTGARSTIATKDAPAAIGPYAQAVRGSGFVFTSMQVGLVPATGEMVAGGIEAETRQVMDNLAAILSAAGITLAAVVKATVYLVDLAEFGAMNGVYGQYFAADPPARATVGVAALPRGARVGIDLIARGTP